MGFLTQNTFKAFEHFTHFENLINKDYSKKDCLEELALTTPDKKFPCSLLGNPEEHFKLKKNIKKNRVLSFPLNLEPASLSGFNVCPKSSESCRKLCLHFSGIPFQFKGKQTARRKRTRAYFENRFWFLRLLKIEIDSAIRKAQKMGLDCGFRLNTTSDIIWESVRFDSGESVIEYIIRNGAFAYDYTKHTKRLKNPNFPSEYNLTFSWSGDNESEAIEAFENGLNIAIPMNSGKVSGLKKPEYFKLGKYRVPVFDGDASDFRPEDPKGVIVGLDYKFNKNLSVSFKTQLEDAIESGFCVDVRESK